jgi:tetratricopeptide (TPR) repeat protein
MLAGSDPQKPSVERWERAWAVGDARGQRREEERLAEKGSAEDLKFLLAWSLSHDDRFAEGERVFGIAGKVMSPEDRRTFPMVLAVARGRLSEARALVEQEPEPRRSVLRAEAFALPFVAAPPAHLRQVAGDLGRVRRQPEDQRYQLYSMGRLLARAKDAAGAEAQAAGLERTTDDDGTSTGRDLALSVRAHYAAATDRPGDAIRLLEQADVQIPYSDTNGWSPSGLPERLLRASMLRDVGRDAEALAWASTRDAHNRDQMMYLAPALLLEGELHERLGARQAAAAAYARAIELWKDCDPELRPRVEEARRKLEALREPPPKQARRAN